MRLPSGENEGHASEPPAPVSFTVWPAERGPLRLANRLTSTATTPRASASSTAGRRKKEEPNRISFVLSQRHPVDTRRGLRMFRVAPPAALLRNWPLMRLKLLLLATACASQGLPQSNSLPQREMLTYGIEWRLVTAGQAKLEWNATQ